MAAPEGFATHLCRLLASVPIFLLLLILGIAKAIIVAPIVFLIVVVGNTAVVVGLYPFHVVWTCYCVLRTRKFGLVLKVLILLLMPVPIIFWPVTAIIGTIFTGSGFGFGMPLIATFEAAGEGVDINFIRCFTGGTLSTIQGGRTIVRDFMDMCYHSYLSFMDGLLEARGDTSLDIRFLQIPGCMLAGTLGMIADVPMISLIVLYKAPVMLYKGWRQLIQDLLRRSGPFMESICVPFAGLLILLWPVAVGLSASAGIFSSVGLGCYASVVAYQENSTKSGLLYVISVISMFDEFTNDFIYMREGSCFPRPKYRKAVLSRTVSPALKPVAEQPNASPQKYPLTNMTSISLKELKAIVIWEYFFEACELVGKELVVAGAIRVSDLEEWQYSKNKIINIGLPSYVFLQCFIRSIDSGSTGFVMRDNVELTSINRPEGRVFDWFFDPMLVLKEQIKASHLDFTEQAYLYKLVLCCGDTERFAAWQNGGFPPADEVKKAQLEGLNRRLHGFTLTLTRMPTFRRRFAEVVKTLMRSVRQDVLQTEKNTDHILSIASVAKNFEVLPTFS